MAKSNPTRTSRVFTISFPEKMAEQVVAIAEEENRTISELFREAFRGYVVERIHRKLKKIRADVAKRNPTPYTEDDVEALVDEVRQEIYGNLRESEKKTA